MRSPSTDLATLAILSGVPAFAEPLHVGRPNIGDRNALFTRIGDALDRRWLTNHGPLSLEFEARVAEIAGTAYCVSVANATLGIELLVRALDLTGEVVVPSWTFAGTAHALTWVGLTPVFCEVDRFTHNLDPDAVEAAITDRTSAILGVHLWGRSCEADRLADIAERHDVHLIFDAAHALGCSYRGRPIGSLGEAEVFSFHATKIANAGEGGAITTNDAKLAQRIRYTRAFGFYAYDAVREVGTNAKMNEFSAAMGLTSLDALDEFVRHARDNHDAYADALAGIPGVTLLRYDDGERHNYHYVVVEVDAGRAGLTRDQLVGVLHAENVLARRYFHPACHRLEPYAHAGHSLPVTEEISECVLVLPTGTAVGQEEIETISWMLRTAITNAESVRQSL